MKTLRSAADGFLRRHWLLLFSFLTAASTLLICSKSSLLYPMNDWVDVHCFLTLGKGLLHGMVPYVDLYEQKGPLLYFLYAIVALFSQKSFLGQYLLEVVSFGLFLYFSGKIACLYLGKGWSILPLISILGVLSASAYAFQHGGSVEQLCLFMFTYGLWSVLNASKNHRGLTTAEAIWNGVFAGSVFWIKYSMVGFYLGLAVFVLVWYGFWLRDWKALLKTIGRFLLGVVIVTVPIFLYFLAVGALDALFTAYFYNNIFLYPNEDPTPLLEVVGNRLDAAWTFDPKLGWLLFIGLCYLLIRAKEAPEDLLAVCVSFFGLAITTYMGKGYPYYAMVFVSFAVLGLIPLVQVLRKLGVCGAISRLTRGAPIARILLVFCVMILCLSYGLSNSSNTYLMYYEKEELPQYKFAQIMHERKEDPTLLNMGFLDGGFYYAADILPNTPFFCSFNVNAPGMWDDHHAVIRERKVDFIVTRNHTLDDYHYGHDYELISTAEMFFEGVVFDYHLYALKEGG